MKLSLLPVLYMLTAFCTLSCVAKSIPSANERSSDMNLSRNKRGAALATCEDYYDRDCNSDEDCHGKESCKITCRAGKCRRCDTRLFTGCLGTLGESCETEWCNDYLGLVCNDDKICVHRGHCEPGAFPNGGLVVQAPSKWKGLGDDCSKYYCDWENCKLTCDKKDNKCKHCVSHWKGFRWICEYEMKNTKRN